MEKTTLLLQTQPALANSSSFPAHHQILPVAFSEKVDWRFSLLLL